MRLEPLKMALFIALAALTACDGQTETQIGNPPSAEDIAQALVQDDTARAALADELKADPDFQQALVSDLSGDLDFQTSIAARVLADPALGDAIASRLSEGDIVNALAASPQFQTAVADSLVQRHLDDIRGPQGPPGDDDALRQADLFQSQESGSDEILLSRQLAFEKTAADAPISVTYFDTFSVTNNTDEACTCIWEVIFDQESCFPEPISIEVSSPPQTPRTTIASASGLCAAIESGPFLPGNINIEVRVSHTGDCSCATGDDTFTAFLQATELIPPGPE